jgi:hypothetical protein
MTYKATNDKGFISRIKITLYTTKKENLSLTYANWQLNSLDIEISTLAHVRNMQQQQ